MKKVIMMSILALGVSSTAIACGDKGGMGEKAKNHFKAADVNGDKQVTLEEFQSRTMMKFKKLDTNGDGVLTREDRPKRKNKNSED